MSSPLLLKAVIFDYSTLFISDEANLKELRKLMKGLKSFGLKLVAFSTHPKDFEAETIRRDLPSLDLCLTHAEVQSPKKSPQWVLRAARILGFAPNQFLYVGDDDGDWITAMQGGAVYLHAEWSKRVPFNRLVIVAKTPDNVFTFATHFLLRPPVWEYALDRPSDNLIVRCLTHHDMRLRATTQERFRLHDVFKVDDASHPDIKSAFAYVGEMLVLHALTSLLQEGLLERNSFYTTYPGSRPGKTNDVLEKFVDVSAKLFKDYYRADIFTRFAAAPDTSMERSKATWSKPYKVQITTQANSVCVGSKYRQLGSLKDRNVVVFDDFMTTGTSLDWARNLLLAAGARQVVLVTMGKYPGDYRMYTPDDGIFVRPYDEAHYDESMFKTTRISVPNDTSKRKTLVSLFNAWERQLPYEDFVNEYFD